MVRHCPRCELRFQVEVELEDHLITDHEVSPEQVESLPDAARDEGPLEAPRRYLVVANQTLGGEGLMGVVRQHLREGPCHFHVLVPGTRAAEYPGAGEGGPAGPPPADDREAMAYARSRVHIQLDRLREEPGATADGEIGDADPVEAIRDALLRHPVDGIILSTLPAGMSRWLRRDLPSRIRRSFDVPLIVVTPER